MSRSRRAPTAKPFVSGGVYDPAVAAVATPTVVAVSQPSAQPAATTPRNYSYQNAPKRVPATQTTVPKQEVSTPVAEDQVMEEANSEETKGKALFKKIFGNRKKSSVRAKEKKIRQNRQLRKVLVPKNALMALNEIKGISISDFVVTNNINGGFNATVTVNDCQYEGKGTSKIVAKNNASEKALRDIVLSKMRRKPRLIKPTGETPMETTEGDGENGVESDGGESADDVPMINLTSFALYKLFSDWEQEGYEIPEFHPTASQPSNPSDTDQSGAGKEPMKHTIRNELPANWETMHPATLLCVMRPGLNYKDYGCVGVKPNSVQSLGVIVDDQEFVGKGRSKKMARRNAAVAVCNKLFGTNFVITEDDTK